MDNTPETYVARLLEGTNKKLGLLQDMLVLTQQQEKVIDEDSLDELNRLIGSKQVLIDEINKLDEGFNVYFTRFKQVMKVERIDDVKGSNVKGIKELQDSIGQVMQLVGAISKIEADNSAKAKKLLEDIGGEIKKINQGKKVTSAYNPGPTQMPSYFIDKKK